jgi:glutamine cyclotransferase
MPPCPALLRHRVHLQPHAPAASDTSSQVQIHDVRLGRDIYGVNELEWVRGELWGNVYPMYQGTASECIARINATSGEVRQPRAARVMATISKGCSICAAA